MKMLSAWARISRSSERWKAKSPTSSESCRVWVQTKNSVEPGRYSQRNTALPRSDRKLKSGSYGAAVGVKSKVRGRASCLNWSYLPAEISGCAYNCSDRLGG